MGNGVSNSQTQVLQSLLDRSRSWYSRLAEGRLEEGVPLQGEGMFRASLVPSRCSERFFRAGLEGASWAV